LHIFQNFLLFSSIFSISFHISTYFTSIFSISFHNFLLYFRFGEYGRK
jgi:predicted membrane protein